jgi:hypothetical protein
VTILFLVFIFSVFYFPEKPIERTISLITKYTFFLQNSTYAPMRFPYILGLLLILASSCKKATPVLELPTGQKIRFINKKEARNYILTDTTEVFFQRIGKRDISLQLRVSQLDSLSLAEARSLYRKKLEETVLPWKNTEISHLQKRLDDIRSPLLSLHPELIPPKLGLVKINGHLYGPNVFFTRESNIFLPAPSLQAAGSMEIEAILIHELAHIFTRTHPEIKKRLYAEIGFRPLDCELSIPKAINDRLLWNPDGLDDRFHLLLEDSTLVSPQIISKLPMGERQTEDYFRYIDFQLYPIEKNPAGGSCSLIHLPDGRSPLSLSEAKGFFEQITRNTHYFIHPDEVIAENIKLIILSQEYPFLLDRLDTKGIDLLKRIEKVMKG